MKKQVILSILFSVTASVATFAQKSGQPNISAAPAPKAVAKDTAKTTDLERADQKTAEKSGKSNEALKAATKRKMENKKAAGTATGKNERREAAQKELRELESKKKAANRPASNSPSKAPQSATLKDSGAPKKAPAVDNDNAQPKKKDN